MDEGTASFCETKDITFRNAIPIGYSVCQCAFINASGIPWHIIVWLGCTV
jgi:hypothetical protein